LKLNSKREREKDVVVQALVQQRIPLMNGDEMLKVFIAKFDVQPWDLTHQVGYLSLSSPSVCAIFYNSKNMIVLGIGLGTHGSILFPESSCAHTCLSSLLWFW
jgi:hypothetical protein